MLCAFILDVSGRTLQFKVDSEPQIFEKLFTAIITFNKPTEHLLDYGDFKVIYDNLMNKIYRINISYREGN